MCTLPPFDVLAGAAECAGAGPAAAIPGWESRADPVDQSTATTLNCCWASVSHHGDCCCCCCCGCCCRCCRCCCRCCCCCCCRAVRLRFGTCFHDPDRCVPRIPGSWHLARTPLMYPSKTSWRHLMQGRCQVSASSLHALPQQHWRNLRLVLKSVS